MTTTPDLSNYILTPAETSRLEACNAALRKLPSLPLALPTPPLDSTGAPVQDRASLEAFVTAYELSTALAVRVGAAHAKLHALRTLAHAATQADPVGVGSYAPNELARIDAGVPERGDADAATWVSALEAHIEREAHALTKRLRDGYRA